MGTTYKDAGVDIDAGNRAVELIRGAVEETHQFAHGKILAGIGGFGALVERLDGSIDAFTTDGVGTKVHLASLLDRYDFIGIDLVAMCANDLAVTGVSPRVFLDYIAVGKQTPERTNAIVEGIAAGCHEAEMALVGGEMAEMPSLYGPDDFDLAGFAVGHAPSRRDLILPARFARRLKAHARLGNWVWGQSSCGEPARFRVYGVPSSGVHANGFGLVWRAFGIDPKRPREARRILETYHQELGCTLGEELSKPTRIYVKLIKRLLAKYRVYGLVHITGGGLVDNPPRVIPSGFAARIDLDAWETPPIFQLIQDRARTSCLEMVRTFNRGIGILVVTADDINEKDVPLVGEIVESSDGRTQFVVGGHRVL